ncbi:MAG: HNH endonuclease family protein [Candidatus Saccharibacteria bacterium]
MGNVLRKRRLVSLLMAMIALVVVILPNPSLYQPVASPPQANPVSGTALEALNTLAVKGRAPKTGYARTQFGDGWSVKSGCDTRNIILARDMKSDVVDQSCNVQSGTLDDPYTGAVIQFQRGATSSQAVQIDHVVALSDAWQTGAQQLTPEKRVALANDPLELLAVDGPANQQKSDGDAATWLPPNKPFRCQYVARQIAVKQKYDLWVTASEKAAISDILSRCPTQPLPHE